MQKTSRATEYILFFLPLVLALLCLAGACMGSIQASLPVPMPQAFLGEYSYDGQTWLPLTQDAPLCALEGDLLLRGHFQREMQEGWHLCFFRNHIGVTMHLNGSQIYADAVAGNPEIPTRAFASMCAQEWVYMTCPRITPEDLLEIRLENPHRFGNRSAYRDFLATLCADTPGWNLLQQNLEPRCAPMRILGGLLTIAALLLLGAAATALTLRIRVSRQLLTLGLLTLFAGGFLIFDTLDISFLSQLLVRNTYIRQLSMMLAVFCLHQYLAGLFSGSRRRAARAGVALSAVVNCLLILPVMAGRVVLYDTLPFWVLSQLVLCPGFLICCLMQLYRCPGENRLALGSGVLLLCALLLDLAGVGSGLVWRSPWSKVTFGLLFLIHSITGAAGILKNHRASLRAARLEKELEDSRIAIMLSQIKPHFLYNVLNTIYHLYRREPETAQLAVSSFAEYLRCNMLSIEKREPIPFTEEYKHIQTYLSLEQIRFRGKLDVVYDVDVTDFRLPPLTVEPLVENAVKHGVTKKRGGGTVTISTRRIPDGFQVTVTDTGVGYDPEKWLRDGQPHVGIRNVRERLQSMCSGTLDITGSPEGTTAVVTIPAKEGKHRNEDHRSGR